MRSLLLVVLYCTTPILWGQTTQTYATGLSLMGSDFEITVVAQQPELGEQYLEMAVAEIQRIEKLISSWDSESQTAEVNRNAGIQPVVVDQELFELIKRALHLAQLTDGAFDITYAGMDRIWVYNTPMQKLPSEQQVAQALATVGYAKVKLNEEERSVFLTQKGMKIGFGALGKGYAADRARTLLQEAGAPSGIINAAGDLTTWGKQPNGSPWTVGIVNPTKPDSVFATLPIREGSVATSGNYEKYIALEGRRFSHIIDPKTGYPAAGVNSVTVFAKSAELCDALATALTVMGVQVGLHFVEQLPDTEAILVDDNNKIHASSGIKWE